MAICWYCYWGWSKPVVDIHNKYSAIAGYWNMHYGAAHIVWDDENFERHHIQWCLDNFDKYVRDDATPIENEAVRNSLIDLLALPNELVAIEPEDYDDKHPENYPPKVEVSKEYD